MIYYIYKVRRKQTSIRFSRSALPHRYLRCISWISWNGGHRPPQAGFPPQCRNCARRFAAARLYPRPQWLCSCYRHLEDKQTLLQSFPKITFFPSFARLSCVAPLVLLCPQALHALPTIHPRPVHRLPPHRFCGLPTNKKMRARGIAPRTRSPKKRRLLAQESTRRHAWLTRSCFGRKNLFIDGPHSLPPFFLSPFLQRKRKKKTEANSAGSNTSLGLTSFVLTMYAIGRRASSAEIYVAIATRFVRDCVEDLDLLTA